ncbi:hypothetical protein HYH03_007281 [Edaphochlamys debaryana]|uniref:Uncharacterized protein n=1 Tax=Edaphochlamys debaryana TaxID=47281 RepID=A0A835Y4E0_9CHLO|nr:hypothetical protein HYH03_007281 [Edaphochlamys debaryana]|eukprot:KAG2494513.1 hypothetical protein HYH03_007281 [Edaphochlamys debaryana]
MADAPPTPQPDPADPAVEDQKQSATQSMDDTSAAGGTVGPKDLGGAPSTESPANGDRQGETLIGEASSSGSGPLPPGYVRVTVCLPGKAGRPAIDDLPIEVLACHSFADVCAAALARLHSDQAPPRGCPMQGYLVVGHVEVPLSDLDAPARAALRGFPADSGLRFDLGVPSGTGRTARARPLGSKRPPRPWAHRLLAAAVNVAKVVVAVEVAAIVRTLASEASDRLRGRRGAWGGGGGGESSGPGSDTEAAMDAVAEYVAGRAEMDVLRGHEPRRVREALEAIDTEVVEQLGVEDVRGTREAVRTLLSALREDEQAAEAAVAAGAEAGATGGTAVRGPSRGAGATPGPASGSGGGAGKESAAAAGRAASEEGPQAPLPGFGPAAGAGGTGSRGRGGR